MDPRIDLKDPLVSFGSIPGLGILIWHKQPTVESARLVQSHIDRYFRSTGTPGRQLTIITPDSSPPSAETRAVMSEGLKSLAPLVTLSAVVVEGEGFMAAAARGVLSGLFLVSRPGYPVKVLPDVDAAARWLRQHWKGPDAAPSVADITSAARALAG